MYKITLTLCLLVFGPLSFASDTEPHFDYGPGESQFKWGVEVPVTSETSDFKLRIGTRLQALMENKESREADGSRSPGNQDLYIRRARLQVEAKFLNDLSYYMDIRADKVDKAVSYTHLTLPTKA